MTKPSHLYPQTMLDINDEMINMIDKIEKLSSGSLIQHGKFNDRIYLLKAKEEEIYSLPSKLIEKATKEGYGKIFAKINEIQALPFLSEGYRVEARIPGLYPRQREALFLAYYLNKDRKVEDERDLYEKNLQLAIDKQNTKIGKLDNSLFQLRRCNHNDIPEMTAIFKEVFPTYPFPIHDDDYIRKTMEENVDYFCIESKGKIVALSSAEKDESGNFAEMTDFATLPDWRGNGLALHLLAFMESSIKDQGFNTAFTIARSASAGMNITFSKSAYKYGGRLKNNTNISGRIESMNIWYKEL